MAGQVYQINVSRGGVPKLPVPEAVVTVLGLVGDEHNDRQNHGGPERALCIYSIENIQRLRAEGHPVEPGWMGENVTTSGIDLNNVEAGDRFEIGTEVVLEVTRFTTPCKNIRHSFADGNFNRVSHKLQPGWSRFYTRVIVGGMIRQGDPVRCVPRS